MYWVLDRPIQTHDSLVHAGIGIDVNSYHHELIDQLRAGGLMFHFQNGKID